MKSDIGHFQKSRLRQDFENICVSAKRASKCSLLSSANWYRAIIPRRSFAPNAPGLGDTLSLSTSPGMNTQEIGGIDFL